LFMRSVYRFLVLALAPVLFYQCQREVSYIGGGDPGQVSLPSPIVANLQGNVLDESGQPAPNVTVKVGSDIAVTDDKGYFRINNASLDKNAALVTAEKVGYFKAFRSFSASSGTNQVVIKLTKKNLGGTFDAANGGDVSLTNGTKVSLPANGIVKASDNSNYTGTVNVYASYIDPTASDILQRVPGSFMANDKAGKRVLLSSYGMMAVELESATGEKLQIKSGSEATITSPIPSVAQSSAPATIPLWYVDEATGLWKEEGSATKQGNVYVGTVKHFTYWNCDIPIQTIKITASFKTPDGEPLVNAGINIKPTTGNYYGTAHGYTDSLGQINGPVPADMALVLSVMDACGNAAYTKNIGPYTESVDLGTITIPASTPAMLTVKGKLTNCSGAKVSKGYAIITSDNWVRYAKVDANGNFSTNFLICNASISNVKVLGVDETAQQQGTSASFPVSTPTTDVGSVSACGVTSAQYINYQIDGTSYSITDADSLTAFTQPLNSLPTTTTYIQGMQIGGARNNMGFKFNHSTNVAGTYAAVNISTQNFNNLTLVQPFNIVITNFPQAPGEFYEGNFTGQFKDASNVTHNVTCTFRVRRNF
jgi:hypothetical protein